MSSDIKVMIENLNTVELLGVFTSSILSLLPVVFPVVGGIALVFFAIRVFRRLTHV